MNSKCLLCNNSLSNSVFPWKIKFNNQIYSYKKCSKCSSVSVDPIPNNDAFKVMYSKEVYHDCHYYNKDKFIEACKKASIYDIESYKAKYEDLAKLI